MTIDEQRWQPESPFTQLEDGEQLLEPESELGFDEREAEVTAPLRAERLVRGPSTTARLYAKITGLKQGNIAGDANASGHEHWIAGTGFEYEVVSPRDVATGLPSGKRRHGPVILTAPWSPASPLLFQALVTNETLTSVVFEFPAVRSDGVPVIAERITLTDATVSDFRHALDTLEGSGVDRISFTFRKIAIDDLVARTVGADDWRAQQSEVAEEARFEAETYEVEGPGVRRSDSETFA